MYKRQENLLHAGVATTLLQRSGQVLPPLDWDMAQEVHSYLRGQGLDLRLNAGVQGFQELSLIHIWLARAELLYPSAPTGHRDTQAMQLTHLDISHSRVCWSMAPVGQTWAQKPHPRQISQSRSF